MKKVLVMFVALSWHFGITASASLPVLSQELDILIVELNDLSGQLLADASEKKMNLIILPFFNWFSGINTTNKKNPNTLKSDQIAEYNRLFIKYTKIYGSGDELYDYYNFGKIFLTFINKVNIFNVDLFVLGAKDVNEVVASKLSQSILTHATDYMAALSLCMDFPKTAQKGFKKPFSYSLRDVYAEITAFAQKIISFKDQIVVSPVVPPVTPQVVPPVTPQVVPPVTPPVVPAHSFILKNFGDSQLSSSSFDLTASLEAFRKTYTQSDVFYSEYEMWAAYVPTRYWELKLLAGEAKAANAFSFTYLNVFTPAYTKNSNSLSDPYAAQLVAMALEFSVAYAIVQLDAIKNDNELYG